MTANAQLVLVLPGGVINPHVGAGQRSLILFHALKTLGPVAVVVLADKAWTGVEALFPGAAKVTVFPSKSYAHGSANPLARGLSALTKLLLPHTTYEPEPAVTALIEGQFAGLPATPRIVAFRYVRTLAVSGLRQDPAHGLFIVVDVDDRDDRKVLRKLQLRFGRVMTRFAAGAPLRRITTLLNTQLSRASLVLIAKPEDHFPALATPQHVVWNVPFAAPDQIDPADQAGETLLFVGTAAHYPNVAGIRWFLTQVWPRIRSARPAARLRIVGRGNWSPIAALARAQDGIDLVGALDDLVPEYARARAAICPILEGAGSQIKVIEACGHARPVIVTSFASGGFGPQIETALARATGPADFADHCIRYLADPDLAAQTGRELKRLQQQGFSRAAIQAQITNAVAALLGRAPIPSSEPPTSSTGAS